MKLVENMTIAELGEEKAIQVKRYDKAKAKLEEITKRKNYQDEVSKYFVGGMVGFRKDRKKVKKSIEQYSRNAEEACEQYNIIEEAKNRVYKIDKIINFIAENKAFGETKRQIEENKNKIAVESATAIKWDKVKGHFGTAYKHKDFEVERVDAGFVAVRDGKGNLLSHYKTVKEAKAAVSIAIAKATYLTSKKKTDI